MWRIAIIPVMMFEDALLLSSKACLGIHWYGAQRTIISVLSVVHSMKVNYVKAHNKQEAASEKQSNPGH